MRIGLTGGIAAGKSTVAAHLKERGAYLIDYDQLAHEVVEPGSEGIREIVEEFGTDAINPDGSLNRRWMAAHVFSSQAAPDAKQRLDDIEHPLIYRRAQKLERQIAKKHESESNKQGDGHNSETGSAGNVENAANVDEIHQLSVRQLLPSPVVVHDVPLLAEVIDTIPFTFDHVLTVEAPEEIRIQRMMDTRSMSREQAEGRIRHQSSRRQREAISDAVIDSTQPIEQMFDHIDMLFAQWK
ncbi:dephospho-CoA kinase [Bifidobacterium sp. ESL0745]|uniref:dephospho-CoA kinase n=1 Tax=Bifidobacterium sp. ESL0745 TaxID=2983226 RepID=UPI0023F82BE2|nr:dephospho-CoA kinase [Bifidobacterium sp. ESL0745]MDF7665207.1 dephospho-CoA kinase [Bifidobacterium sp. ESL0745]